LAAVALASSAAISAAGAADRTLDALVAAYPDHLAGYDEADLILKNGQRIKIADGVAGKSAEQRLDRADIDDMFVAVYPKGPAFPKPSGPEDDPGRARNAALFDAMYGDCRKGEVARRLKRIRWLPGLGGGTVEVTTANGVADRLEAVSRELEALPAKYHAFLKPSAGTFNCRAVAGTSRMSMHAYAAAIDINVRFADYWRWSGGKRETDKVAYKNRIPMEIVSVFEKHGFIWGGKWYHYDTMHFEYRPEILALAR
jgi:hypothetical protein